MGRAPRAKDRDYWAEMGNYQVGGGTCAVSGAGLMAGVGTSDWDNEGAGAETGVRGWLEKQGRQGYKKSFKMTGT